MRCLKIGSCVEQCCFEKAALCRSSQSGKPLMIDILKPSKCFFDNFAPEVTFFERLSAATQLILAKTAFPDKSQFSSRAKSVNLPQKQVKERAAAPAESTNEQNFIHI